jgi:hypothetical protein
MSKKPTPNKKAKEKKTHHKTPTFVLELPLETTDVQAKHLRGHLEAARQLYNAMLSAGQKRLNRMRTDPGWEVARAIIDWDDVVVNHGLKHRIKFTRIVPRKASSPEAKGADALGYRYYTQLVLEGSPYQKPKHQIGKGTVGADLGPSTIAVCSTEPDTPALHEAFCEELDNKMLAIGRLQRRMDRQRKANNSDNYDELGRIKKQNKQKLRWKSSKGYQETRRRKANLERKNAAHRKSLHNKLAREIVALGNTIQLEKISYKAWQKHYGKSVRRNAPGMFIEQLKRLVASTGGILVEIPTQRAKLSQFCHGCGTCVKKPLSQRWHSCSCGVGPVQRDLYSAFLAAYLPANNLVPSCDLYNGVWEGAESRLRAAHEEVQQRANAGQSLPQSMGIPRARARQPKSLRQPTPEPLLLARRGGLVAWKEAPEPPRL